jgi:hypothetical protein
MNPVCFTREETSDHVHLLVSQSKNIALAKLLKELKQGSSLWIKTAVRQFRDFSGRKVTLLSQLASEKCQR